MSMTPTPAAAPNDAPAPSAPDSPSSPAAAPAAAPAVPTTTPEDTSAQDPAQTGADPAAGGAASATTATDVPENEIVLSAEERQQFGKAINALPDAERALLQKFLTQKTQRIANHAKMLEQLDANPVEFAREILRLSAPHDPLANKPADAPPAPSPVAAPDQEATALLEESLGEYAYLAPKLAPALSRLISKALDPITGVINAQQSEAIKAQATAAIATFKAAHPDWEMYYPKMQELSREIKPNGMDHGRYLTILHTLASADKTSANATRKIVDALTKAAGASESPSAAVPAARVAPTAPRTGNFAKDIETAFQMAKRGERAEY